MFIKDYVEKHSPEEVEAFMKVLRLLSYNTTNSPSDILSDMKVYVAARQEREAQEKLVSSFVSALKGTYEHLGNGEVYVCTGDAEGIVVKVVRRGPKMNTPAR